MAQFYYTYYSYEEFGRGYIGSRKSKVSPEKDISYFGSYKDKTFHPTQKIILTHHNTREEALAAEMKLHEFYDVANNSHFANLSKLTSERFCISVELMREIGRKNGKKNYELGLGISSLSEEEKSEVGKKGGNRCKELGLGVHSRTKEEMIEHGKKLHKNGLGIHGLTVEQRKKYNTEASKIQVRNRSKEFVLVDPYGNIHKEKNINKFCRENKLDGWNIRKVLSNKIPHYKGWTTPDIILQKLDVNIYDFSLKKRKEFLKKLLQISGEKSCREFILMDTYGNIHKGKNVSQFCKKHNLDCSNILRVLEGIQSHHKGWRKYCEVTILDFL
jgi:general stress protein YciG